MGGWYTAVKHAPPKQIKCHSPFYITTNKVPDFGDENENVKRRIHVFNTSSLSTITPGNDQWIFNNAMDSVAWIAQEVSSHRDVIPPEEGWYEDEQSLKSLVLSSVAQWNRERIMQISQADLNPQQPTKTPSIHDTIHEGFITKARTRRLARKRRLDGKYVPATIPRKKTLTKPRLSTTKATFVRRCWMQHRQ